MLDRRNGGYAAKLSVRYIKAIGGKQSSEQFSLCEHSGGQNREDRSYGRLLAQLPSADIFFVGTDAQQRSGRLAA